LPELTPTDSAEEPDYLRLTAAPQPTSNEEVVRYYLDRRLYLAAHRAAEHFESQDLADLVDAEFGAAWSKIELKYEGMLTEVRTIHDDTRIEELRALLATALLRLDPKQALYINRPR
jgi:hypothetical protein